LLAIESGGKYVSSSKYQLHALINILKTAKSSNVPIEDMENTKFPRSEVLSLAILHLDDLIRGDALGLICDAKRDLVEPTREELDLLKKFIITNMSEQATDFSEIMYVNTFDFFYK
jgi:hypothetical protein